MYMQNNFQNKKIVFFGTPAFTVEFLELFKTINLQIVGVVTATDKPVGRGMEVKCPLPKKWAVENNIVCLQPHKLDDNMFSVLENLGADLFIVIAYGKIMPEKFINIPPFETINLHYSLLPKYRGASPVESAILNADVETGITIQQMAFKLDSGPVLYQETLTILETETSSELRNKLNKKALEIFPKFLENLFSLTPSPSVMEGGTVQDESEATFCHKFKKEDFDVTKEYVENDLKSIYKKYKAYDKKIFFIHTKNDKKIRIRITEMNSHEIQKILPESRKEILYTDFLKNYK